MENRNNQNEREQTQHNNQKELRNLKENSM